MFLFLYLALIVKSEVTRVSNMSKSGNTRGFESSQRATDDAIQRIIKSLNKEAQNNPDASYQSQITTSATELELSKN